MKAKLAAEICLALMVLGALTYHHLKSSPLNGWWLRDSGTSQLTTALSRTYRPGPQPLEDRPDQMTLIVSNRTYKMKYWDGYGMTTVTLPIDGRAHLLSASRNVFTSMLITKTCWLEWKGDTLLITRKVEQTPPEGVTSQFHWSDAWTETWTVTPDRKHLVISKPGEADVVYSRASLWTRLWTGGPS